MSLTKIGSIGINTGIQFAGVTTVSTLHVGSGVTLSSDGDVFATGISTFSEDIKVGSGVTISPDGDGFYTGVVTATTFSGALAASNLTGALPAISGANLTNLDASDLASGTVPTARLGSGTASSSTFLRGDSTFQTVDTDLVSDTSPQLGGSLDVNNKNVNFGDSSGSGVNRLRLGASNDLQIYHGSDQNYISVTGTGNLNLTSAGAVVTKVNSSEDAIVCNANGSVDLYHDNVKTAYTKSSGFEIKGGNTSDQTELQVIGNEGQDASILLGADDGDDNADYWRMYSQASDNAFTLKNYAAGSYETSIRAVGNGTVELYYDNAKMFYTHSTGAIVKRPSGGETQLTIYGCEGNNATLLLAADDGDDNADYWRFLGGTAGQLDIASYSTGSWVNHLTIKPDGEVQKPNNPAASVWTSSSGQGGHSNEVSSGYASNGNETFDVNNDHGLVSSIGRFTCPVDGRYRVSFFTNVSVDGLTGDAFNIQTRKNGATVHLHYDQKDVSSWQYMAFSDLIDCSANDYLQIYLKAGNGSSEGTIGIDGSNAQWNSTFYELVA